MSRQYRHISLTTAVRTAIAKIGPFLANRGSGVATVGMIEALERRTLLSQSGPMPTCIVEGRISMSGMLMPDTGGTLSAPFSPAQIDGAYGLGNISFNGVIGNGSGQTIAIVDAYNDPNIITDAATFNSHFSLPQFNVSGGPTLAVLNESGNSSGLPANAAVGGWDIEESLDVQYVHAVAPQANIILYEANSNSWGDLMMTVRTAAANPSVSVVSNSWGGTEFLGELFYDSVLVTPSGHQGITFLAGSGDKGAPGGYPAVSPDVLAVGGTSLTINSDGSWGGETGWSGSGGGISSYESQPAFQAGKVNGLSSTYRTIPDVAMDADPNAGVSVLDTYWGGWYEVGGTSLACPLWAGMIAIANQGRALKGLCTLNGSTQTLPALYDLSSSVFHDIASGNNGYAAGTGYDLVTGLGSAIGNTLVPALVSYTSGTQLAFAQQPGNLVAGNKMSPAVTVDVENAGGNIVPGDTSNVTLSIYTGPNGATLAGNVTVAAVNGVATFGNLSLANAGNYTLKACDGNLAAAYSNNFSVTAATAAKLAFVQQPGNSNIGQAISPVVTVDVEDQYGNIITTNSSSVTLSASPAVTLGGMATVNASGGVASFDNVSLPSAGNYTLSAADGTLTTGNSSSFIIVPNWLNPASVACWNAANQTLTVTGNATIIGNPATFGDDPSIIGSSSASNLTVDTQVADGGDGDLQVNLAGLSGNGTVVLVGTGNNSVTLSVGDNNANATYTGVISGPGSLAKDGSGTLVLSGDNTYSGNTTVLAGTLDVAAASNGLLAGSAVTNNAALQLDGVQTLGMIGGGGVTTVSGTGWLTAGIFTQAALVNNGAVNLNGTGIIGQLTGGGNLTVGNGTSHNTVQLTPAVTPDSFDNTQQSLTVGVGSTLDITNNTLLLNYGEGSSPLAAVASAVAYGVRATGSAPACGAIVSSTANAGTPGEYTIGFADATELGSVPTGNVQMQYTLTGDANLTGTVDFDDFSTLQNHYDQSGADWSQGDFNHDGQVNFDDFSQLQNNYGQTVATGQPTTVTYILSINDDGTGHYSAGHYAVYASDSTNNGGLANYDISLGGISTVVNCGPKGSYDDGTGCGTDDALGFTFARSGGSGNAMVMGSQDTIGYANGAGVILVYGFGQTAGNLVADKPAGSTGADGGATQAVYGAPLLLIKGTFNVNGPVPAFTSQNTDTGNVLVTNSGSATEAATLVFTTQDQ